MRNFLGTLLLPAGLALAGAPAAAGPAQLGQTPAAGTPHAAEVTQAQYYHSDWRSDRRYWNGRYYYYGPYPPPRYRYAPRYTPRCYWSRYWQRRICR